MGEIVMLDCFMEFPEPRIGSINIFFYLAEEPPGYFPGDTCIEKIKAVIDEKM